MIYPTFSVNCYCTRHDVKPEKKGIKKKEGRVEVGYKQNRVCIPGLMFY